MINLMTLTILTKTPTKTPTKVLMTNLMINLMMNLIMILQMSLMKKVTFMCCPHQRVALLTALLKHLPE